MKKANSTSFKDKISKNVKKQKEEKKGFGYLNLPEGIKEFKEKPGRVFLDIIPYMVTDKNHPDRDDETESAVENSLWYRRPFKVHRNVGSGNDSLVCPSTFDKKCPICEYRKQKLNEGVDWEELKPFKASDRNLYVVVPIGNDEYEEELHIWDMSQHLFQNLLNDEIEEDADLGMFPSLDKDGLTLKIRFDEKVLGKNKFAEASRIDFKEREEGYDPDIINDVPNLDDLFKLLSYEQIHAKFMEVDEEELETINDENENDDPDVIVRKGKGLKKAGKKETVVEENEEEEEEIRKPKSLKRAGIKRTPVKQDIEEEEEEEEEIKPKKGITRKSKQNDEGSDEECPSGYTFGEDNEKFKECERCPIWEACADKKDELDAR